MLKRSFLNRQETAVALLYRPVNMTHALSMVRNAYADGADGVTIEISALPEEERTPDSFKSLITSVPLPFMFVNYRNDIVHGADDEARQKPLLMAAEAGADCIDVMGDLFCPSPRELTFDRSAVEKQKALIREIHARGSHVLMSSHTTSECVKAEEVLAHLQEQSSRGADLLKIVVRTETEEEMLEGMKTMLLLKKSLDKPFIYLGTGSFGKFIRYIGPKFGVAVEFAVCDYPPGSTYLTQPTIRSVKNVMNNFLWEY